MIDLTWHLSAQKISELLPLHKNLLLMIKIYDSIPKRIISINNLSKTVKFFFIDVNIFASPPEFLWKIDGTGCLKVIRPGLCWFWSLRTTIVTRLASGFLLKTTESPAGFKFIKINTVTGFNRLFLLLNLKVIHLQKSPQDFLPLVPISPGKHGNTQAKQRRLPQLRDAEDSHQKYVLSHSG